MADIQHKNITGADAAHPPFYPSESDPTTTLGAYRGWFKPSTGEAWIRNAANTAWLDVVVTGTSTALTAHLSDATDAHDASAISIVDAGTFFTGTNVEAALQELGTGGVTEIDDLSDVDTSTAPPADGQTLIWDDGNSEWIPGSVAAGTVAATDVTYAGGTGMSATDAEAALDELATEKANASDLTDHISDATAAHAASAISYAGGTGMSATNAEAAIDELATEKANDAALTAHIGDTSDAHDASAISILDTAAQYTATEVEGALAEVLDGLQAHEADTTDAHDASAISIVDSGAYFTATHVEGALQELGAGGGGGGVADLDDLTDVVITSPATDDVLVYNGSTWVNDTAPGGGGGGDNDTRTALASDVPTSSTSAVDVTGLSFAATSGVTYYFRAFMLYTTSTTTNGSAWGLNGPAATNLAWRLKAPAITATTENLGYIGNGYGLVGGATTASPNTDNIAEIEGIIKPSASGTVIVRFASESGAATITVKAGSFIDYAVVA